MTIRAHRLSKLYEARSAVPSTKHEARGPKARQRIAVPSTKHEARGPKARQRIAVPGTKHPGRRPARATPYQSLFPMYRTISDFVNDWSHEQKATLKNLERLTDASLDQRVTEDGRSLGFLAWHLVQAHRAMLVNGLGLPLTAAPGHEQNAPDSAAMIAETYRRSAEEISEVVPATWNDEDLLREVNVYGRPSTIGATLMDLVKHEAHHRGQITVLMRQAGLATAGVYGPAKEEWASMGMEPMR